MADLTNVSRIVFTGHHVTLEPGGDSLICADGWIATGWQDGIPISRKPIPLSEVHRLLASYPHSLIR